jgi:hypothetical protein
VGVARALRDVGRDVVRILALDQVGGHRLLRIGDLAADDIGDRLLVEALRLAGRERVVEVRAERPV